MLEVTDQAHLESLPDGTIIRWRRIPDDPTSEAVAFVRVEVEQPFDLDQRSIIGDDGQPILHRTVWISPGGWAPMTVEEAGITYPCEVVLIAAGHTEDCHRTAEHPPIDTDGITCRIGDREVNWPSDGIEVGTYLRGGTWSREKALECATQWTLSDLKHALANVDVVLKIAEAFDAWLNRD